jgi:LysR family hydrogen peroxide-inducible transcriptional activator
MEPAPVTHYPTFKQLRYFVALVEHKHFGRAAAQCFVSQSAFSIAIQELEALLGANLVDRTNRRVTITSTGQEVAVLGIIATLAPFLLPRAKPPVRKS